MKQKTLIFDKQCYKKNEFHQIKKTNSIDKVDIKSIMIPKKDWYGRSVSFKYLLDIKVKLMLFQYHYGNFLKWLDLLNILMIINVWIF